MTSLQLFIDVIYIVCIISIITLLTLTFVIFFLIGRFSGILRKVGQTSQS